MEHVTKEETRKNKKKRLTDVQALAVYQVSLTNADSHSELSQILATEGFDAKTLAVGRQLLAETNTIFKACTSEQEVKSTARQDYYAKRKIVDVMYA